MLGGAALFLSLADASPLPDALVDDRSHPPAPALQGSGDSGGRSLSPNAATPLSSSDSAAASAAAVTAPAAGGAAVASASVGASASASSWASLLRQLPTPMCRCAVNPVPAIQRTVRKAGPTQGRSFWVCPKPEGARGQTGAACDLFLWADTWARMQQQQQQQQQAQQAQHAAAAPPNRVVARGGGGRAGDG